MLNEKEKNIITKPPVVVVLGHVDHGKSSLLEAIKKEIRITAKEAGGITQHIGAYEVEKPDKSGEVKKITFIDTPGHEAFSAMRSRGAKVADIALLVVDASEGVKNQTKESIQAIKEAGIPLIVVLNKIDKPQAQPDYVKHELQREGVVVESLGGKIPSVNVSAKTGQGIEELLETILLVAELEELKADASLPAEGTVIESSLDAKTGPVATLIVKNGRLKQGDILATPTALGKAKRITDFQGKVVQEVLPGQPCQVLGFDKVPQVGERFKVYPTLEAAQEAVGVAKEKTERKAIPSAPLPEETKKTLNVILKADFLGSVEAIEGILEALPQEEVGLKIVKKEVGNIDISDIQLAEATNSKIFGFRVKIDEAAKNYAQQKKIKPRIFEVIYELVEGVKNEMSKLLSPEIKRIDLGKVRILVIFKKSKEGQIVGGRVIEGEITRDSFAEVKRGDEIIGKGRIKSLQQEKRDIVSAGKGKEVGMLFQGDVDIEEDDVLVIYKEEREKKTI
jgi:translation initiation factor IF-2